MTHIRETANIEALIEDLIKRAGDSLFMASSMALRAGADIWQASYLGALAAALQVSRVGNLPLTTTELGKEIDEAGFSDE